MKLNIIIDADIEETTISIKAPSLNDEVIQIQNFINNFEESKKNYLLGFKDEETLLLKFNEIIVIYAENKNIFCKTRNGVFKLNKTLKLLEEILPENKFIRINNGEIVSIDYIDHLEINYNTISISLKNNEVYFVSRRSIKKFKDILGL